MRARPLTYRRLGLCLGGLALFTLAAAVAAVFMGAAYFDLSEALGNPASNDWTILHTHRIPRVVQGLLVGAVLGTSGAALQGLLRNPLADPFILGVSGGAALGASAVALTGMTAVIAEPLGGFLGALAALVIVAALANRHGHIDPVDMLLAGVIFNALAGALLTLFQALASPDAVQQVLLKLLGDLSVDPTESSWLTILVATTVLGLVLVLAKARSLDLLALGDDAATSLGVAPDRLRLWLFVGLSIPIGAAVALTGLIGFVGLIVPHAVRLVLGPDHRLLLPACAFVGAAFVVLADGVVRLLAIPLGTELPVGVITAIVGGPTFLLLLRRRGGRR